MQPLEQRRIVERVGQRPRQSLRGLLPKYGGVMPQGPEPGWTGTNVAAVVAGCSQWRSGDSRFPRHPTPSQAAHAASERVARAERICSRAGAGLLVAALMVVAVDAEAQTAVCSNTPATGERVSCMEDASSTDDISLALEGVVIDTTADDVQSIYVEHLGEGRVSIDVVPKIDSEEIRTDSSLSTTGNNAPGLHGRHDGTGDLDITSSSTEITTTGTASRGIYGFHKGDGNIDIESRNDVIHTMSAHTEDLHNLKTEGIVGRHQGVGHITIVADRTEVTTASTAAVAVRGVVETTNRDDIPSGAVNNLTITVTGAVLVTSGRLSQGINAWHQRATDNSQGRILVTVRDGTISTSGHGAAGIWAHHQSEGDVDVNVTAQTIHTHGGNSKGIVAHQEMSGAESPQTGNLNVYAENITIETRGPVTSDGIYARNSGVIGDVNITVVESSITTKGTGIYRNIGSLDHGIRGEINEGVGNINIIARGGSVTTLGTYSYGIFGIHRGDGYLSMETKDGNVVTTTGDNAHGIVAYHFGTEDTRSMEITVGGTVEVSGANAQGVRVGTVNSSGVPERVAGLDEDGYRRQTVRVNGRVYSGSGAGIGVFLAGGGRVYIGPRGSVGAASGIAIRATGDVPDANPEDPPMKPMLYVDINLDGRRVAQVIGDDWIINDGGETTIVVNGVKLHDGAGGVVRDENGNPIKAPNGAVDVWIRDDGPHRRYHHEPVDDFRSIHKHHRRSGLLRRGLHSIRAAAHAHGATRAAVHGGIRAARRRLRGAAERVAAPERMGRR